MLDLLWCVLEGVLTFVGIVAVLCVLDTIS